MKNRNKCGLKKVFFHKNPIEEVRKLLRFPPLASMVPTDLEERLLCLSTQVKGFFKREHRGPPLDFDPFTREMKVTVNRAIGEARRSLKKLGFTLPAYERAATSRVSSFSPINIISLVVCISLLCY